MPPNWNLVYLQLVWHRQVQSGRHGVRGWKFFPNVSRPKPRKSSDVTEYNARLSAMKKMLTWVMSALLMGLPVLVTASAVADDKEKDEDRLKNCGTVLKEILDIPDNVPKDLLDKADCVVVFPSVLKAAFVIGGSYGRGAMTCRQRKDFSGPWGAPTMMALE